MDVACEMEVELLHGDHLRVAAAGSAALDAKSRALRRLAQASNDVLAEVGAEGLHEADRGGALALAQRRRRNARHDNVLSVRAVLQAIEDAQLHLGLVAAVGLELAREDGHLCGEAGDRLWRLAAGNVNVARHRAQQRQRQRRERPGGLGLLSLGSRDGVTHEHGHGHGAHTSRHRRDHGRDGLSALKVDVAHQALAGLLAGIVDGVHAAVDDHCARLEPLALDKAGLADGGDEDVGLLDNAGQVGRLGVADGHRGVGPEQQLGHGAADDVAAAEHNGVLAGQLHARLLQQVHASVRRAADDRRLVFGLLREQADVGGVEAVHILGRIDEVDEGVLVNRVLRVQRQLHQDAVHVVVFVQVANGVHDLKLGRLVAQMLVLNDDADLLTRLDLLADVDGGVIAIADLHDHQLRRGVRARLEGIDVSLDRVLEGRRDGLAVDDCSHGFAESRGVRRKGGNAEVVRVVVGKHAAGVRGCGTEQRLQQHRGKRANVCTQRQSQGGKPSQRFAQRLLWQSHVSEKLFVASATVMQEKQFRSALLFCEFR
eukprot:m.162601 g.162601  ORF g.162601 m.162601 type:complete len:543 (-) comp17091_c0_seq1:3-1631(-)